MSSGAGGPGRGGEGTAGGSGSSGEHTSLRLVAASGAKWTSASTGVMVLAQLAQIAILARLLTPAEFGLAATIIVIIGFARTLGDVGLTQAIIARPEPAGPHLSSLYWLNAILGASLAVLVLVTGPLITALFAEPRLGPLLPLAALHFVITPVGQQFQALLQKSLDFRTLARIESVAAVCGPVAAVALAISGVGAASIVGGFLVTAAVKALMLAAVGWRTWRPTLRLRRDDLRGYLSFGANHTGAHLVNYLGSNIDYIMVARFLGAEALGVYAIVYQLISIPRLRLNPMLIKVAFPVFARRQHDDASLRRGYLGVSRLIALITFPAMAGMGATAPYLVEVVFGSQWAASAPVLEVSVILGMLFALASVQTPVFLAKQRPDITWKIGVARLVALIAVLYAVVGLGLVAVAWGFVAVTAGTFVVGRLYLQRVIGLSWRAYLIALREPALVALAMAAVVLVATPALVGELGDDALVFAAQVVLGVVVYGLLLVAVARRDVVEVWQLLLARRPRTS